MNDVGASSVTETSPVRVGSADGSGLMFDRIARRYDLMNRLISFGLDGSWRKKLLAGLGPLQANDYALDVATGTGDVALAIARCFPGTPVKGLDPSVGMLEVGRQKVKTAGYEGIVDLIEMKAYYFDSGDMGSVVEQRDIPEDMQEMAEIWRHDIIERIAELDDELTELFLEDESAITESLDKLEKIGFGNIVIIKSTTPPGACMRYSETYNLNIVFN